MKIKNFLFLLSVPFFTLCFYACQNEQVTNQEWQMVYRNDKAGNKIAGDKNELIEAVRMGLPIRVGFGGRRSMDTLKSVEHVADAQFLTIANGSEVFAQISPIVGQKPYLDADTLSIHLKNENSWTIIVGTNGESSALSMFNDSEKIGQPNQRGRGTTWYVKGSKSKLNSKAKPLWD